MLRPYGLSASYSLDISDNSYSTSVQAVGMGIDETWMRLQRFDELQGILEEIVFASDDQSRTIAIQRAGCMLDSRAARAVK